MDRKLQLITTKDVGMVAADALINPGKYRNKAVSLAGDSLTPAEANAIFKQVRGTDMPTTYNIVGASLRWALYEQLGSMFDWFKEVGFGADVEKLRRQYPDMQDFKTWLKESSAFR